MFVLELTRPAVSSVILTLRTWDLWKTKLISKSLEAFWEKRLRLISRLLKYCSLETWKSTPTRKSRTDLLCGTWWPLMFLGETLHLVRCWSDPKKELLIHILFALARFPEVDWILFVNGFEVRLRSRCRKQPRHSWKIHQTGTVIITISDLAKGSRQN